MNLKKKSVTFLNLALSLLGLAFVMPSHAASYPDRPITLVVPFPPGGTSDSLARGVARGMSERLGVTIIVENKGGAGTLIGTQYVAHSKPDGYTLLWAATPIAINPTLYKKLPYNTLKDLTTAADIGAVPMVLVVNPASHIKTLKELVDKAKASPKKLTYGSSGVGGSPHLATALFTHAAGIQATHVPYKGSAPAVTDLIANQTDFVFDTLFLTAPFIKAGKLVALGLTSTERSPLLPNVPTIAESGYPGYQATSWFSLMAPAATPQAIIAKLNKVANEATADPKVSGPYTKQGIKMLGGTPEQAQERLKKEIATWGEAVKLSGAQAD